MTRAANGFSPARGILLALLSTLSAAPSWADTLVGTVVGVSDGDTVTVLVDGHREVHVRIAGIDAPEKRQPFGQAAKKLMSDCSFGKPASIEWKKLDRYGRTVGKLTVAGTDCGLQQIEAGLAWHYKAYEREQTPDDRLAYGTAEKAARTAGKGLWSDAAPQPPWEFRRLAKHGADPKSLP